MGAAGSSGSFHGQKADSTNQSYCNDTPAALPPANHCASWWCDTWGRRTRNTDAMQFSKLYMLSFSSERSTRHRFNRMRPVQ